jgi:hypothetical protein
MIVTHNPIRLRLPIHLRDGQVELDEWWMRATGRAFGSTPGQLR